jgi:hypothetical protein
VFIFILFCCVADISQEMAINSYDIVSTLQALGMMKYWKGKHIILKKQASLSLSRIHKMLDCFLWFRQMHSALWLLQSTFVLLPVPRALNGRLQFTSRATLARSQTSGRG